MNEWNTVFGADMYDSPVWMQIDEIDAAVYLLMHQLLHSCSQRKLAKRFVPSICVAKVPGPVQGFSCRDLLTRR